MMITGRGFPRPSLWFMGGLGYGLCDGLRVVVVGFRGALVAWLPSSYCVFGCFCCGRGCNSISIFLWHCLCVVLFYVNAF